MHLGHRKGKKFNVLDNITGTVVVNKDTLFQPVTEHEELLAKFGLDANRLEESEENINTIARAMSARVQVTDVSPTFPMLENLKAKWCEAILYRWVGIEPT